MDAAQQSPDAAKHLIDWLLIPAGPVAVLGSAIGLINGILTMIVLLTSIGWGIYRMIEMHRKLYPAKK